MDPGPLQRVRRGLDWLTERVRNDVADLGLEAPATNNGGQQRRAPNPPMKRRRTKSSVSATIRSIREGTWGVSSPNNANDIDLENQGGGRPGSSSSSASRQRRPSSNANGADDNDAAANEDNIEIEPVPPPIPWHTPLPTDPPSMRVSPKCRLMRLPPEVQLQVFRHLSFGDLERMRRTSVYYRSFLRPAVVQFLHGGESGLRSAILSHCCRCLVHDPEKKVILMADRSSPDWPLSARCLDCAAQAGEMKVGTKVMLGNFTQAWVCRWCGYPIRGTASYHHAQFHRECYNSYNDVLLGFFVLGWIQLSIGIVAAALAWRYFRGVVMVFAPTVTSFILLWFCIVMLLLRGNVVRTFHLTLVLELIIACLWIPPVYTLANIIHRDPANVPRTTVVTLSFFCLNMLFRLINILGNIVLTCEYNITKHHIPHPPLYRRLVNPFMAGLIYWTYPQAVERKFPPEWQ